MVIKNMVRTFLMSALVWVSSGRYFGPPWQSNCLQDDCKSCHPRVGCLECDDGYYLDNGSCNSCRESDIICVSCTASGCSQCAGAYFLSDDFCLPCPYGCLECSEYGICEVCEGGEIPNADGSCPPVPCILALCEFRVENCDVCRGCNICDECKRGYVLDIDNNCICDDPSCKCEPGYFYKFGECFSCRNFDVNCVECSDWGSCDVCAGGYFYDGQKCQPCSEGCISCQSFDRCDVCEADLLNEGDENSPDDEGAPLEDEGGCDPIICIEITCPGRVENCEVCRGCSLCEKCQDGFYLDALGNCIPSN